MRRRYRLGPATVAAVSLAISAPLFGAAPDVVVAGVFPGKALLIIDGGPPRAVAVGTRTAEGVRVVAIDGDAVTYEVEGERRSLRPGERVARVASARGSAELVLAADARGHFRTAGLVNGARVEFLIDTGATLVSLGMSDARRAGIDFTRGQRALAQTANGVTPIWRVRVDALRIGDVVLHNVEAAIHEHDLPAALLGMSVLGRFDVRHEGQRMVMRRRY